MIESNQKNQSWLQKFILHKSLMSIGRLLQETKIGNSPIMRLSRWTSTTETQRNCRHLLVVHKKLCIQAGPSHAHCKGSKAKANMLCSLFCPAPFQRSTPMKLLSMTEDLTPNSDCSVLRCTGYKWNILHSFHRNYVTKIKYIRTVKSTRCSFSLRRTIAKFLLGQTAGCC